MYDWSWQNCTTPDDAIRRINSLENTLKKYELTDLLTIFQNRTCKILEIGAWDGTFLQALKNNWFSDIKWLDKETYRAKWNDWVDEEVEKLIKMWIIQNMGFRDKENKDFTDNTYDIVVSKLVFDHGCYREQKHEWFREMMLWEVHRVLKPNGLYFANERHQRREIIEICENMTPRANTLVRDFDEWIFIPARNNA